MISILLFTASRPDMLRTALHSIASQTALNHITEVIVSENGGDARSGAICADFPSLPITYILREKTVLPIEHAKELFSRNLKGEFTAMLHDDDWWTADHLEKALKGLKAHPSASAYYCSYFKVFGESSPLGCYDNLFFWFGAGYPAIDTLWVLNQNAVLLASLLGTGAIYSSLVAKTTALRQAARIYDEKNTLDNDRMFALALAQQGQLLYGPNPQVYYRTHAGQDTRTYAMRQRATQMSWTTSWLIEQSGGDWKMVGELFAAQILKCPEYSLPLIREWATKPWCLPLLVQHAEPDSPVAKAWSLRYS
jgi:hypothetical protein